MSPGLDDLAQLVAEAGTEGNPIELDLSDIDDDDLMPTNRSCVEVDAGDGVAFCTRFKICANTKDFFAFVNSLVPPDIQAAHSSDTIRSVMVRFANPTKLDTNKMRVYRKGGNPTIMRLNEQLSAPMKGGDSGLKFVVEWQRCVVA